MTLKDTDKSTSSPGSADGASLFDSPEFPTPSQSGPALAHASPSHQRASGKDRKTTATCGPTCSGSSASAALQECLENRLRQRLDTVGSMEYSQTWKVKATPAGRLYLAHTASARLTSGSGFIGWPTPTKGDRIGRMNSGSQLSLDKAYAGLWKGTTYWHKNQALPGINMNPAEADVCKDVAPPMLRAWLMGYPATWLCPGSAMRSCRK